MYIVLLPRVERAAHDFEFLYILRRTTQLLCALRTQGFFIVRLVAAEVSD